MLNIPQSISTYPGASDAQIERLREFMMGELPSEYVQLLQQTNGGWGWLNGRYLILHSVERAISLNVTYVFEQWTPGRFEFGSDGGGNSFLLQMGKVEQAVIFECDDVCMSNDDSIRVATSLEDFFQRYGPLLRE